MLVEANDGKRLAGIDAPKEMYWVLVRPAPLAGMTYPRSSFPWIVLKEAGFTRIVSLEPGEYDPAPLTIAFCEQLQDLVSGGPPRNEVQERQKITRAVNATVSALQGGEGVVVHCRGGRGRTGTVLGCVLRELGFGVDETIEFLDGVHKARGKPGWPESCWQSNLVRGWKSDA